MSEPAPNPAPRRRPALTLVRVDTRDRLRRLAWAIVYTLLYRPSPRPFHGWRRMLLRLFGARIGARAHPYPLARIWAPWRLSMAAGSALDNHVDCYNTDWVYLGVDAVVSQYSYLCTGTHDLDLPGRPVVAAPIFIHDAAWVAVDCFIGPGVRIGAGAVVYARSSVTRDVEDGHVVVGSPPKLIRVLTPGEDGNWRSLSSS